MTDQESRRYRCPGCGNEESGALIEAIKERGPGPGHFLSWICTYGICTFPLNDYQLIDEPEAEGAREWAQPAGYGQWHRFLDGCSRSVCGTLATPEEINSGTLYVVQTAVRNACPDCLPKPVEGGDTLPGRKGARPLRLIRDVTVEECHWLPHNLDAGTTLYRTTWCNYGCTGPGGIQASFEAGVMPGYEVPLTAIDPADLDGWEKPPVEPVAEEPPPQPPEWVPPEWDSSLDRPVRDNVEALAKSLAAHVNAMLARPEVESWGASPEQCSSESSTGLICQRLSGHSGDHFGRNEPEPVTVAYWRRKPEAG